MSVSRMGRLEQVKKVLDRNTFMKMQDEIHDVYMKKEVYGYALKLVTATRENPYIERGASPRATIALVKMAKASAWLEGRDFVTPNDVSGQFPYVVSHRIILNAAARMESMSREQIITKITQQVHKPALGEKGR